MAVLFKTQLLARCSISRFDKENLPNATNSIQQVCLGDPNATCRCLSNMKITIQGIEGKTGQKKLAFRDALIVQTFAPNMSSPIINFLPEIWNSMVEKVNPRHCNGEN